MSRLTLPGRIESGKLIIDRALFAAEIAKMPDGAVTIKVQGDTRSERQNRLYWLYLTMLEDVTGHSRTELHTQFRTMFNARTVSGVDTDTGEIIDVSETYPSTTEMTTVQFTEYLDRIKRFAAEFLGTVLPDPMGPES